MKKSYIKLLAVELFILLMIVLNMFILKISTSSNMFYMGFWILLYVTIRFMFGFEKDKKLYKVDVIQSVFIYSTIFLLFTYILGIFTGFFTNSYSLEPLKILTNTVPVILLIVLQELIRYIIITKGKAKKSIMIGIILIFILVELMMGYRDYDFSKVYELFEFIIVLLIPSILRNMLLTYISFKAGYKPTIIYRLLFEVPLYFIPFIPDLGIYLTGILYIVFPVVMFIGLNTFFAKFKPTIRKTPNFKRTVALVPTIALVIAVVALTSGVFKVYALTIMSNSMHDTITRGDIVVLEKLNEKEIKTLKVGDIIAHEHDNKMIVHRIYEIDKDLDGYIFRTKGDNNENVDNWEIKEREIKGIVKFNVKFIGYPSVWLNEAIK